MLKMPWNIQKTPLKHVKRLLIFYLETLFSAKKIRFSAQMSNKKTMKHSENTNLKCLSFFKNFWKSGSRLKNQVLGSDVEQC